MEQQEYNGSVTQMKDSPWLASEDFLGRGRVKLEVEKVFRNLGVKFEGGREEKKPVYSIKFKKLEKQLVLNATNRGTMSRAFGSDVRLWAGKVVEVGVVDGIRKPGTKNETTTGLRVFVQANPELIGGVVKPVADDATAADASKGGAA